MVDPRMAQATAVHTKIATIAPIRLSMVVCVSTLSAAPPTYLVRLALSSTFHCKVRARPGARGPQGRNVGALRYSIGRSCTVLDCAAQSLCEKILPVQDRASCLPESSRRALVADAREIRQHQMHSLISPEKCDGHRVRRASVFFGRRAPHPSVFGVRFLHRWICKPPPFNTCRHHSNYTLTAKAFILLLRGWYYGGMGVKGVQSDDHQFDA